MRPRTLLVAFAALAIAGYALLNQAATAPPEPSAREPQRTVTEPTTTPIVRRSIRPDTRGPRAAAEVPPAINAPPVVAPPSTTEIAKHLAGVFAAERAEDARVRARPLEANLQALLPTGSSIQSVECRGTLCRVELRHASLDAHQQLVQRAFRDPVIASGPLFVTLLDELAPGTTGPVSAIAYLGAEGTTLPMP
jgi:hypothetical protein